MKSKFPTCGSCRIARLESVCAVVTRGGIAVSPAGCDREHAPLHFLRSPSSPGYLLMGLLRLTTR